MNTLLSLYKCIVFITILYLIWISYNYPKQYQSIQLQFQQGIYPKTLIPKTREVAKQIEQDIK
jgi:hypothetical protein